MLVPEAKFRQVLLECVVAHAGSADWHERHAVLMCLNQAGDCLQPALERVYPYDVNGCVVDIDQKK